MISPNCDIELGTHHGPWWRDKMNGLRVCDRHKAQYEERADEFDPFDWELSNELKRG